MRRRMFNFACHWRYHAKAKPISLYPLTFDEAIKTLLHVASTLAASVFEPDEPR